MKACFPVPAESSPVEGELSGVSLMWTLIPFMSAQLL